MAIRSSANPIWDTDMTSRVLNRGLLCWYRTDRHSFFTKPPHRHAGLEILFCLKGQGVFTMGDEQLPYSSGSLLLFDPQVPHHVTVQGEYVRWNICFLPEVVASAASLKNLPTRGRAIWTHLDRVSPEDKHQVYRIFEDIKRELLQKRLDYQRIVVLRLEELVVLLHRFSAEQLMASYSGDEHAQPLVNDILAFIDRHIHTELSVARIAQHFNISVSSLYRLLQSATGRSASRLIIERRVARAQRLLADTDCTVSEVAHAVGFKHTSYFCTLFKKQTGQTPSAYREWHQQKTLHTA